MTSIYETNSIDSAVTEGRADKFLENQAKYGRNYNTDLPILNRMVVLDVIHDPTIIDDAKLDYWQHKLGIVNIQYARTAPRNSIIAQRIIDSTNAGHEPPILLYPLFSSHLSLPCKAGEHVWAVFESPQKVNDLGYWLCRITTPHFVDDVNHSHAPREHDTSFVPAANGNLSPVWEFNNGVPEQVDGSRVTLPETAFVPGDNDAYDNILRESDASMITQYESVPRYRKRPGDIALEGTNNSLVVLGTDRAAGAAKFSSDPDKGQIPQPSPDDAPDHCGCIDIVAGRGQTAMTAGGDVINSIGRTELDKAPQQPQPNEGDPDFIADRSRIHVSQRVQVDKRLGIDQYNKNLSIQDDPKAGAVFAKSDKIRAVARKDLQLLVTGFEQDNFGRPQDPQNVNGYTTLMLDGTTGDATLVTHGKSTTTATGDHTVTTSGKSSTTSDGDLTHTSTKGAVKVEAKDGTMTIMAKKKTIINGSRIEFGDSPLHPLPLFDLFLKDLHLFLLTLVDVLQVGTVGSPVKQQLIMLSGQLVNLNRFINNLTGNAYKSQKVHNE